MKYLVLPLVLIAFVAQSQTLDLEKTFDVSKDAQKGFIYMIQNNEAKQQLRVVYRVKAKRDQIKFIGYNFDYNFNLVNQDEKVINLETDKLPEEYRPKKYRGENFEVEGLFVEPNMMGTLVLKRKVTRFNWNWFSAKYNAWTSVEGKLKAKTDDDKKLFYHSHLENDADGTAMILTGEKGTPKNGPLNHILNYHFVKYDINLTKLADVTVNFETPQALAATYGLQDEDGNQTDFIAVFATTKIPRYVGGGKLWGEDPTDYTYVRVSYADGKLVDRISFKSPNSLWRIDEFVKAKDGSVFFYGPSNDEKKEYYVNRAEVSSDKTKWPTFQLAKVNGGKMEFVTSTTMDDFKSKLKPQPDGKKGDPYNGRRVTFSEAIMSPNGELILAGQNYGLDRNGKGQIVGRAYEDLVMFHFDAKGTLVSEYTMNKKKAANGPDGQFFEFSSDGKYLYWTFFDNIDTKSVKELDVVLEKPLPMPKMAKIDLAAGTFAKYSEYGSGDNFVHYGGILNYLRFTNTNQVNYLGENKKGSSLWFCRVNLDK
ncbi:MAG TPA: hypothetical protein VFE50_25215 [Cyclobacteriaceae bacterium]|nr:hypothetical protein [Cyclobacteriaceae bacterium]